MKQEEITVGGLIKLIESGEGKEIRLKDWQIARLFGVYEQTVRANIKSIIQTGVVKPSICGEVRQVGKTLLPEVFDLEMIIALSFRLTSSDAAKLREWIIEKVIHRTDNRFMMLGRINNPQILN
ncbi:hypothetical protein M2451_003093 [Dysgonomonas sp. PFB1-18]|uniref:hypothetical protein n=1 Tax=unclassified Dysgonomonas TaxID=2630389 RepID=UPI002473C5DD|nr:MULTISPECIES: hypothetical protein [unclassified Dysgonomonas]MDH6310317.1 hypothetical protein [Dysgonomonas sp. PF1-14]MDH6340134.1 hypothetical protein [Dysgonomonas sp. PF1-16]MDH6381758.1 hypothetical protein [Dysgonomonas sp. PFB1-18]MDH6399000.1 hypothetical protein [Dysgonomonas sp. PF1-23]